jgi:hypothetical protein
MGINVTKIHEYYVLLGSGKANDGSDRVGLWIGKVSKL